MTQQGTERIAQWQITPDLMVTVDWDKWLNLTVRANGFLVAFNLSTEKAQEVVNRIAGQAIWTA